MRRLMVAAVLVLLLAAGPALAGQDGEERLYGPDGEYQGRATPDAANPQQKSLYGPNGEYQGRVMTDPATGESRAYDTSGRYLGRTTGGQMSKAKK